MKKFLITGLLALFVSAFVSAQGLLEVGEKQLNGGIGLSGWGIPFYIGGDYGIYNDITVGGEVSFRSYSDRFAGIKYRHSIFGIIANGNYHFNTLLDIPSEWDAYAGLNLGYFIWNSDTDYLGASDSGFDIGIQIGGRYYFQKNMAVNIELTGGSSTVGTKLGITYKF